MSGQAGPPTVYTIGHGSRPIAEFIALLRAAGVECVVDVRAHPGSRRHPQFGREALECSLARAGIRYVWEGKALGGRRHAVKGSRHSALTSGAFRAYADHMTTAEFRSGLKRLLELGVAARTAILCAERLPWECHRNLIADSLVASGNNVTHLVGPGRARVHELNELARRDGDNLIYDAAEQLDLGLPPSAER